MKECSTYCGGDFHMVLACGVPTVGERFTSTGAGCMPAGALGEVVLVANDTDPDFISRPHGAHIFLAKTIKENTK